MNFNKIKITMVQKKVSRKEIAHRLQKSPYGFDRMIKSQSMKVQTLEKISEILDVPVSYWFDEDENMAKEPGATYKTKELIDNLKETEKFLKNQIEEKDKQINFLRGRIEKA